MRASTTGAKKPPCLPINASKTLVTIKWGPAYSVSFRARGRERVVQADDLEFWPIDCASAHQKVTSVPGRRNALHLRLRSEVPAVGGKGRLDLPASSIDPVVWGLLLRRPGAALAYTQARLA